MIAQERQEIKKSKSKNFGKLIYQRDSVPKHFEETNQDMVSELFELYSQSKTTAKVLILLGFLKHRNKHLIEHHYRWRKFKKNNVFSLQLK